MSLAPGAISEAAAKGNEMLEKLRQEAATPAPVTPPVETPPVEAPPVPPTSEPPVPPSTPAIDKAEIDRIVQDRINALESTNTGRLRVTAEENRQLKAQMADLQKKLETLEQSQQAPVTPPIDIATRRAELVQQDGEESETVRAFDRDIASQRQIAHLTEQIGKLSTVLEGVQTQVVHTERSKYLSSLSEGIPKWREHIDNPKYSEFLQQRAPFTSRTFLELAQEADERCDPRASIDILKQFEASIVPATPPATPPAAPTKDSLIAPDTKSGVQPDKVITEKRIYSLAEAMRIKNEITSGRFKGTPEEKKDLADAALEGRIR